MARGLTAPRPDRLKKTCQVFDVALHLTTLDVLREAQRKEALLYPRTNSFLDNPLPRASRPQTFDDLRNSWYSRVNASTFFGAMARPRATARLPFTLVRWALLSRPAYRPTIERDTWHSSKTSNRASRSAASSPHKAFHLRPSGGRCRASGLELGQSLRISGGVRREVTGDGRPSDRIL